jgi:hypothetical protein
MREAFAALRLAAGYVAGRFFGSEFGPGPRFAVIAGGTAPSPRLAVKSAGRAGCGWLGERELNFEGIDPCRRVAKSAFERQRPGGVNFK